MNNQLIDPFNRRIEYVRLSVTDKCNQRCFYCMPKGFKDFEQPAHWLTFDEIERVITAFTELGVRRVRLTGGEPLLRKNLPELAQRLNDLPGLDDLSLSTNASLLARHAEALKAAGVKRINVSLDSLKPDRYKEITTAKLADVIHGLETASAVGLKPIKINMVALKGVNDDEFVDMLEFCLRLGFTLRYIETMPMGAPGLNASQHYIDLAEVKQEIEAHYDLTPGVMPGGGPARYYQINGSDMRIGFITPISRHFCDTCNRVRVGVDGRLYLCLGDEHSVDLRQPLRDGISNDGLKSLIIEALALKPKKHEFVENPTQIVRLMSMTGG